MSATNFKTGLAGLMALTVVTMTALFTGCGGLGTIPALVDAAQSGQLLPLGTALPALPDDNGGDRNGGGNGGADDSDNNRGSSAAGVLSYPGAAFLSAAGGTVDGDTLILQSSETEPAWAMYKADGLTGLKVDGFGVETIPGDLDSMYSVGLSNFSEGQWEYMINSVLPEVEIDLTDNTKRLTSQLGNLYWVVIVTGGKSVRVVAGHVFTETAGDDDWVPGMGDDIVVSQGLADRIHIEWRAMDGADQYELWRRLDDDASGKGASTSGSDNEWTLVATTAELGYDDFDVLPSTEYDYKVRGINAAGPGGFSRSESGYMGAPPAGGGDDDPGIVETQGVISGLSADRLTLDSGASFLYTDLTLWFLADGTQGGAGDFAVGYTVEVRGEEIDGVLTALAVKMDDGAGNDPAELHAMGEIATLGEGVLTLADGQRFNYGETTLWKNASGELVTAEYFQPGMHVQIEYVVEGELNFALKVKEQQ